MTESLAPEGTVTTTVPLTGSTYQDRTLPALEPVAMLSSCRFTARNCSRV